MFDKMKKAFDNNSHVLVVMDDGKIHSGKLQGVMDCGIIIGQSDIYIGFYRINKVVIKD